MAGEKTTFIKKLITKYFLYGYLCLLGMIACAFIAIVILKSFSFPKVFICVIPILGFLPLAGQFFRILFSTHYKYRYYKISLYRLRTRGYKDDYFECEMHEPCFKLIIKDILICNGYKKEYYGLCKKCNGRNIRVEKAKINLLKKVQERNKKNMELKV